MACGPAAPADVRARYEARIAASAQRVQRDEQEQAQIKDIAESLERKRDAFQRHQAASGIAVIYLQITILLSSVSALTKKRPLWYAPLVLGTLGLVQFANGLLLFFGG